MRLLDSVYGNRFQVGLWMFFFYYQQHGGMIQVGCLEKTLEGATPPSIYHHYLNNN